MEGIRRVWLRVEATYSRNRTSRGATHDDAGRAERDRDRRERQDGGRRGEPLLPRGGRERRLSPGVRDPHDVSLEGARLVLHGGRTGRHQRGRRVVLPDPVACRSADRWSRGVLAWRDRTTGALRRLTPHARTSGSSRNVVADTVRALYDQPSYALGGHRSDHGIRA